MFLIVCSLSILLNVAAVDTLLTGTDIVDRVDDIMAPQSSKAKVRMTISTTAGEDRDFVYWMYAKNHGEKTLIEYESPVQVKNQATLMLNNADDIWAYFPRTGRVRKLATHAKRRKMQGSDFSYEDIGSGRAFITDFSAKRLSDTTFNEKKCYTVLLTPKGGINTSYSRLKFYVERETFYPLFIEYYHREDSTLLHKKLLASQIREVDDIPTAYKMTMENVLDRSETVIEILEVNYDVELPDEMFSVRGLKR